MFGGWGAFESCAHKSNAPIKASATIPRICLAARRKFAIGCFKVFPMLLVRPWSRLIFILFKETPRVFVELASTSAELSIVVCKIEGRSCPWRTRAAAIPTKAPTPKAVSPFLGHDHGSFCAILGRAPGRRGAGRMHKLRGYGTTVIVVLPKSALPQEGRKAAGPDSQCTCRK